MHNISIPVPVFYDYAIDCMRLCVICVVRVVLTFVTPSS